MGADPRLELEQQADALRDALAAIRCAWRGDREGLGAITRGTAGARLALGTMAALAITMTSWPGVSVEVPAHGGGEDGALTAAALGVVDALRAGGDRWHTAINSVADPRGCFAMLAILLGGAAGRALTPSALDQIGRDATDVWLDIHLASTPGPDQVGREVMKDAG